VVAGAADSSKDNLSNTTHTITAIFDSRAEAEHVADHLVSQLSLSRSVVRLDADADSATTDGSALPRESKGLLASLAGLFVPDTDRHTYAGGMRRGGVLLSRPPCRPTLRRAAGASSARRRASSSIIGQGHAG
jgi:hypothetical protein